MFHVFGEFSWLHLQLLKNLIIITVAHSSSPSTIFTPNLLITKFLVSSLVIRCLFPICERCNLLFFILNPGFSKVTATSNPITPIPGSYSIPGISKYSLTPNEKLPLVSIFLISNLFSTALNNLESISSAFAQRKVTLVPIGNFGRKPQVGILFIVIV